MDYGKRRSRDRVELTVAEALRIAQHDQPSGEGHETSSANPLKRPASDLEAGNTEGWQVAESKAAKKRRKKQETAGLQLRDSAETSDDTPQYPALNHAASARLHTSVRIADLQNLVLYMLGDNIAAPQWIAVRQHREIEKVVVLMVPGVERSMFDDNWHIRSIDEPMVDYGDKSTSPDAYYPTELRVMETPAALKPFAYIFKHVWPVRAPGDDRLAKIGSPLQAMLQALLPKAKESGRKGPQPPRYSKSWADQPTVITSYIANYEQLIDHQFTTLHPAVLPDDETRDAEVEKRRLARTTSADGWVDSAVSSLEAFQDIEPALAKTDPTAGKTVYSLDCEMCKTTDGQYEVTRVCLLDWAGNVKMDELVKPDNEITDYVTAYSGITKEMLEPVKTRLSDIQAKLKEILTCDTIVIGHSLDSDFNALRMTHPAIVDTTILYPHPGGLPLKSALKFLSQKYLSRDIQKSRGGHSPIEDAKAAMDLVKLKCQKGPEWGTSEAAHESIFSRIGRLTSRTERGNGQKTSAIVDWGSPRRGHGAQATYAVDCNNDEEVVAGVKRAAVGDADGSEIPVGGADFVWGRLRKLEAKRGWWTASKTAEVERLRDQARQEGHEGEGEGEAADLRANELADEVARTAASVQEIYEALPACTAFIVYTGQGSDPRELSHWHSLQQQHRREFATKRWEDLSIKWTDVEEQAKRAACRRARAGLGFMTVK